MRLKNFYRIENFKPEIKTMFENLQDELTTYKQKVLKFCANIRSWRAKKASKLSTKYLKDRICKIKQYLNYILMIINQNISAILRTFLNLEKKSYEKLYIKLTSTAATTEFLWKIPNRKKISNEHFNLCEAEISLDEIIKSINSETNNNPPGNNSLTAEFHKHSSNELAPAFLDVYDSWRKFDTMGGTYRIGIISVICKGDTKKILQTLDPFQF